MLSRFGVSTAQGLAAEIGVTNERTVAKANDRQVLGTINGFGGMLELSLPLAETPCSPIGMNRPRDMARELFSALALRLVKG